MEINDGVPAEINEWMALVTTIRATFPGLETAQALAEHQCTVLRFMEKHQALCMKDGQHIVGVLLFSRGRSMICCLGVHPAYRRQGIASALLEKALGQLNYTRDITVSTFRAEDPRGIAPRALYGKFGFVPAELTVEFGCPNQVFVLRP